MQPTCSPSPFRTKVPSIALVLHSSEHELFLTAPGERRLSLRSMVNDEAVRNFFSGIVADTLASDRLIYRVSKINTSQEMERN